MAPNNHIKECEARGDARVTARHQVLAFSGDLLRGLQECIHKQIAGWPGVHAADALTRILL